MPVNDAVVRHEADRVDGLVAAGRRAAARQQPVEQRARSACRRRRAGGAKWIVVRAAPAPAVGVRPKRSSRSSSAFAQRLDRQLVPVAAADQLGVALVPQLDQPREEAPRRRVHRREAELRLRPPALGVVGVADRRLRDEHARSGGMKNVVDRAGDRVGVEPVVPALAAARSRAPRAAPAAAAARAGGRSARRGSRSTSSWMRAKSSSEWLLALGRAAARSAAARQPSRYSLVMWCG